MLQLPTRLYSRVWQGTCSRVRHGGRSCQWAWCCAAASVPPSMQLTGGNPACPAAAPTRRHAAGQTRRRPTARRPARLHRLRAAAPDGGPAAGSTAVERAAASNADGLASSNGNGLANNKESAVSSGLAGWLGRVPPLFKGGSSLLPEGSPLGSDDSLSTASSPPTERSPPTPAASGPLAGMDSACTAPTRQASSWRDLANPIKIEGRAEYSVRVQDPGGEASLDMYMRLPVEAYSALDPGLIQFLGGDRFLLKLPRLSLFSAWLAPEVEVGVTPPAQRSAAQRAGSTSDSSPTSASASGSETPSSASSGLPEEAAPQVLLQARACRLVGSPAFASLEGRFALRFCTQLTWHAAGAAGIACAPMGPGAISLASWDDWEEEEQEQEQKEEGSLGSSDSDSAASGAAGLAGRHAVAEGVRSTAWEGSAPGSAAAGREEASLGAADWEGATQEVGSQKAPGQAKAGQQQAKQGEVALGEAGGQEEAGQGVIRGHLVVAVWAEPIPPFHLLPRGALRRGGNAVLGALIRALLPLFMSRLGEDYERWALDETYRESKAKAAANAAIGAAVPNEW